MQKELQQAIELLKTDKPQKRQIKPVAISLSARKRWQQAHDQWLQQNYREAVKAGGLYAAKMPTLNANGFTRFICMYLQWQGWRATRVSSAGRMVGGKFIPSTTKAGSADISSTIEGKSIMWEVKINTDRPSSVQLAEQERERKAGGEYFFVHTPDEFFQLYDTLIEKLTERDCNTCLDMAKVINVKIDVKKIDKAKLYQGEKGTYLDAVMFVNDEADQYGNWGMIVQSVTKEEKEKGVKGAILGNVKTKERLYTVTELKAIVSDATGNNNIVDMPADDLPF